ncbi:hypothetical protein [Bacillus cereus]|uniref:hypothetical protein n=1 Tax=Bacillus cereus TaxID=1396 RepID=UPI000279D101|nr:hypothetical protein [Bacillus cereus]EJR95269.1 hypothetical protein IKG_03810 [Bacillus cereus VD200]
MSSHCTCHINSEECTYCRWKGMRVGTFGCGAAIKFPDGKLIKFHTLDIDQAHELADALSELVFGFEMEVEVNEITKI